MWWITWLRGFSIRTRLLACMILVAAIGTVVGVGTTLQLRQLQQEFDTAQQVTATTTVQDLVARQHTKVDEGIQKSIVTLWVLLLSPGIIFLPFMALTIASVTGPLKRAEEHTKAITQGILSEPIGTEGHDEITRLMECMGVMQDSLRSMVFSVRESSQSMLVASTEIAAGNHDLSNRTEQAAANLQQTASSMVELSNTVDQSALSANVANMLADTACQRAEQGGQVVESVVVHMEDITKASRKIADILSVIDGIAFQTNILALNAAVEAARAGEQGRGFAVVAGEVRSLAKRSADAAREIKTLIAESVDRVEVGSERVKEAGAVMVDIVDSIRRVTQAMSEIADATSLQAKGISHVGKSVSELDKMTQQNAALVEESAAAAASLRHQAIELTESVARFQVDAIDSAQASEA